jgi:hypothetical protein
MASRTTDDPNSGSGKSMAKSKAKVISKAPIDGAAFIRDVLKKAQPRPDITADDTSKIQYAVRFADHAAERMADDLRPRLKNIEATTKRSAQSERKKQQLDINFSTPALGLALGISLKSVHIGDKANGRYTHNVKRNLEELRIEAFGFHKRQPYAVMVAVLFLPFDSCADGKKNNASSFGSWVQRLRPYAERRDHDGDYDVFEKVYIALYETDGSDLSFFDVANPPPKNKRPSGLLSYAEFLDATYHAYLKRNHAEFKWADEEGEAPLDPTEEAEDDEPASS